jgi:hypothetical protein
VIFFDSNFYPHLAKTQLAVICYQSLAIRVDEKAIFMSGALPISNNEYD